MRESYRKQLDTLHRELILLGALCEDAIACAVRGLLKDDPALRDKATALEREIDLKEREIETFCVHLLMREQPVAGDLRQITAAQHIITDMERIGDQAENIAELSRFVTGNGIKNGVHLGDMADATVKMLTGSVDAFVASDFEKAQAVIAYDREVDALFKRIKGELIDMIVETGRETVEVCLDLLMIAKYLERIGDHAQNIAEWVEYSITGQRKGA
ncbi:MAG: phosphate signaling complex protein PhoU [Spirochaetaceae bacterium]|jgi:phosphate transport system protein|nr:phosphate signaling complex protein PhoU [Spirochaetaceae bacterium]